jgi:hypothetical protein
LDSRREKLSRRKRRRKRNSCEDSLPEPENKKITSLGRGAGRPLRNSLVHRYFVLWANDVRRDVPCQRCGQVVSHRSTSLKRHIAYNHTEDKAVDYPIVVEDAPLPRKTPRMLLKDFESRPRRVEPKKTDIEEEFSRQDPQRSTLLFSYFAVDPQNSNHHVFCVKCDNRVHVNGSLYRLEYHYDMFHRKETEAPRLQEGLTQLTPELLARLRCNLSLPEEHHPLNGKSQDKFWRQIDASAGVKSCYVWGWFSLKSPDIVVCECTKKLKYNNKLPPTINMMAHLERFHNMKDPFDRIPASIRSSCKGAKTTKCQKYPRIAVPDTCRICNTEFEDDNVLVEHIRSDHLEKEVTSSKLQGSSASSPKQNRSYTCDICYNVCKPAVSLALHRKEAHGVDTVLDGEVIHPKSHQDVLDTRDPTPKVACEVCGSLFLPQAIKYHILRMHRRDELPYKCDQCERRFESAKSLLWHRRKHRTDIALFVCDECGLATNDFKVLKLHKQNAHENKVAPNKVCPDCGERFPNSKHLTDHRDKVHTGIMRFQCHFCGRKFWRADNMRGHVKSQHKDGVRNEALFQENDKKDWRAIATVIHRAPRTNKPREGRFIPTLRLETGVRRAALDTVDVAIKDVQDMSKNLESKFKAIRSRKRQEAQPFTEMQAVDTEKSLSESQPIMGVDALCQPTHCTQDGTPSNQGSFVLNKGHNTQYCEDQEPHTALPLSAQQQSRLTCFPNETQNQFHCEQQKQQPMRLCKLCHIHFPDVRKHIVDFHKIPLETGLKLMGIIDTYL